MELQQERSIYGQRIRRIRFSLPGWNSPGLLLCDQCMREGEESYLHIRMDYKSRVSLEEPDDFDYASEDYLSLFPERELFFAAFDRPDFEFWELDTKLERMSCKITGRKDDVLSVAFSEQIQDPSETFLHQIEEQAKSLPLPEQELAKAVMETYHVTRTVAKGRVEKLFSKPDLFWEFVCRQKGLTIRSPASANGYTAETLHQKYPLSWLGAYLYLVELREHPYWAEKQLREGLKRK